MLNEIFLPTNQLKILSFFSLHPDESFHGREISRRTKVSLGGTNAALNALFKQGLLSRKQIGKNVLFVLNDSVPALQYFKILNILTLLEPVIEAFKEFSRKIILFGSFVRGENTKGSDVDLLIVSNQKKQVRDALKEYAGDEGKNGLRIQAVIRTTAEWMILEKKDPTFFSEIFRGITLWDKQKDGDEERV